MQSITKLMSEKFFFTVDQEIEFNRMFEECTSASKDFIKNNNLKDGQQFTHHVLIKLSGKRYFKAVATLTVPDLVGMDLMEMTELQYYSLVNHHKQKRLAQFN